jgi:hypothetical protein
VSESSENPTLPLPTIVQVRPSTPRRRHRGLIALVVIVVVLALLVVAFVVGDRYAHTYATNYVRQKVATALELKSTAPVHVDLGTGSIILQAISGHLDRAKVTVDPLTIQGVTGAATVDATDVPLDSDKPVGTMDVTVRVPTSSIQSQLTKAVPQLRNLGAKFAVSGGHIHVTMQQKLLFITIPISADISPGVKNGAPTFSLDSLTVSGVRVTATTLDRFAPGLLTSLKSGQSICIASYLPKEFTLTGVALAKSSLVYRFSGDGAKLNDAALNDKGTCPKN